MKQRTSAGRWMLVGALLATPWLVQPADAQATNPGSVIQPQGRASGVLIPPDHVDPGMTRPIPNIPAQSMPVIHPRQLRKTRHGTVRVVPK